MRHRHIPAFFALLALSCAPTPAPIPESPAPIVAAPAPIPEPPQPLVAEEPARLPDEVREPAAVACRISGTQWSSYELKLRAGGPSFAHAIEVPATLVLPVTASPKEAVVVMDDGLLLVRAVLELKRIQLYALKPTALLGIVTPEADTGIGWASSTPGSVKIALNMDRELRSPRPFVADLTCADLAIVPSKYDARATITKQAKLAKRDVIKDGAPLAPAHKAAPVAELNVDLQVELVQIKAGQARILVDAGGVFLSGWVALKDLGPAAQRMGIGYGRGTGYSPYSPTVDQYPMRCDTDLGVFVELGSERVKVGAIRAKAGFHILETEGEESASREVDPYQSPWLRLEKGARLVADAAELKAHCHDTSPHLGSD